MSQRSLTASLLTPPGRGAVAVVRIHAADATDRGLAEQAVDSSFIAANGRSVAEQSVGRLCYGYWQSDEFREDVVVCRTDEATIEVSCHGGRAAIDRVLESLRLAGASVCDWQTQQCEITSPFESELLDALSRGVTARASGVLLDQMSGVLQDSLNAMMSLEDERFLAGLNGLLEWSSFGLHLTDPWRVVLAGRPNVGKSTLINALLGFQRAIVFDQPGTTRDVVTGQTAFDGWPFQIADTAGIRSTVDELERAGIDRARRTVETADLLCLLLDTSQPATREDQELLDQYNPGTSRQSVHSERLPVIVVAHKVDLPDRWEAPLPDDAIGVSSTEGTGLDDLMTRIVQTLIPRVPSVGTPVPVSRRQVQWLMQARCSLESGDRTQAIASVRSCLDGLSIELPLSSVEVGQRGH